MDLGEGHDCNQDECREGIWCQHDPYNASQFEHGLAICLLQIVGPTEVQQNANVHA